MTIGVLRTPALAPKRAEHTPFVRESTNLDLIFVLSRTINFGGPA